MEQILRLLQSLFQSLTKQEKQSQKRNVSSLNSLAQSVSSKNHHTHCTRITRLFTLKNLLSYASSFLQVIIISSKNQRIAKGTIQSINIEKNHQNQKSLWTGNYHSMNLPVFDHENPISISNDPVIVLPANGFPSHSTSKISNHVNSKAGNQFGSNNNKQMNSVDLNYLEVSKRIGVLGNPTFLFLGEELLSFLFYQIHVLGSLDLDHLCKCLIKHFCVEVKATTEDTQKNKQLVSKTIDDCKRLTLYLIQNLITLFISNKTHENPSKSISQKILVSRVWFDSQNYIYYNQQLESSLTLFCDLWCSSTSSTTSQTETSQASFLLQKVSTLNQFLRVWQLRIQFFESRLIPCLEKGLKFFTCTFVFEKHSAEMNSLRLQILESLLKTVVILCEDSFADGELQPEDKSLQNLITLTTINSGLLSLVENTYFYASSSVKNLIFGFLREMLSREFKKEITQKLEHLDILEASIQQLEDNQSKSQVWLLFLFWRSFFSFEATRQKATKPRLKSFCKNLIFKLKVLFKGDAFKISQIETFKTTQLINLE